MKHLNDLVEIIRMSGYSEMYSFKIIKSGLKGFEKILEVENGGCRQAGRPVNRTRSWGEDQRQKNKEDKSKNWYKKGGFDVPHTPGGVLARRMKDKEAENNQGRKIRFKIIEKGGVSLDQKLRRSNPWAGGKCGRRRCFPCMGDKGGKCWREGVTYSLWCKECDENVACYKGKTVRNSYTCGLEHLDSLAAKSEKNLSYGYILFTTTAEGKMCSIQ